MKKYLIYPKLIEDENGNFVLLADIKQEVLPVLEYARTQLTYAFSAFENNYDIDWNEIKKAKIKLGKLIEELK